MFILSGVAIKAITDTPGLKAKLCLALVVSENSIYRFYTTNAPNNDLTKYAALKVLRTETGYSDKEILEEVSEESKVTVK
ncbi:MAG: hypothetical protein ABI675_19540 [Chitinophagaceae bacterium]